MNLRIDKLVVLILVAWATLGGLAEAQLVTGGESIVGKLNPFNPFDPSQPVTVVEICKRLDCIAEQLRDDGLVVVKQPDVFSQARLTRFRNDFDVQMSSDLTNFHLVLAARINRLDAATTTQTTALSAALSAPGTTNVTPPTPTFMDTSRLFPTTTASVVNPTPTAGPLSNISLANQGYGTTAGTTAALGLGVDPTVYLDEKKRFLEHLNQIRRISLGPDQNDSSGYGLYLVRLPVSITPGECTYHGHGAELSVTVEHEFTPDFLPTTFQNLVVNDLADQLGPFLYETIRSGFYEKQLLPLHNARERRRSLTAQLTASLARRVVDAALGRPVPPALRRQAEAAKASDRNPSDPIALPLESFILRLTIPLTGDTAKDRQAQVAIAQRLTVLADTLKKFQTGNMSIDATLPQGVEELP